MKKPIILIISFAVSCISITASGQTNNNNSNSTNSQNPVIIPPPPDRTVMPVTAPQGTELNNRVMLKAQTDSMDSKRGTKPANPVIVNDTIGTGRSKMRNGNPVIYPGRKDSIR